MNILAIDPGPEKSAWLIWTDGKIHSRGIDSTEHVLNEIVCEASCWMDVLAIEKIACYGMAVGAEVFETCVNTGRFMERWTMRMKEETVLRIPRLDIKVHLCKTAKAKDTNIRQALIDRFGAVGTKKNPGPLFGISSHCWAALAVAVTCYDRLQVERATL